MSARYSGMRPVQLAALALVLTAASAQGQSAWAYADVYYDAATDRVIATTTTLVDYSTEYYYSPKVQVSLSGSDGSYAWWYCPYGGAGACTNGNYAYGDVFVSAAPGVTYTVQGFHSVETYYYYYDMDPGCTWGCYQWYDALGYSTGVCSPWCQANPPCWCVEKVGPPYFLTFQPPWVLHLVYAATQVLGDTSKQATTQQALLSCNPSVVTRGSNVNCTVTGPGSSSVTNWKFESAVGNVPGPSGVNYWGGIMVQSGTISAKAGGLPTQPAGFNITVNPRSGWATQPKQAEQQTGNVLTVNSITVSLPVPPAPTGEDSGLGYFGFQANLASNNGTLITTGPNSDFQYFQSEVAWDSHWARYIIHTHLDNTEEVFYKQQCPQLGYISGANLKSQTRRHEYNHETQSHHGKYKNSMNLSSNNPGTYLEGRVLPPGGNEAEFYQATFNELQNRIARILADMKMEPYPVNHDENNNFLGNINYTTTPACPAN